MKLKRWLFAALLGVALLFLTAWGTAETLVIDAADYDVVQDGWYDTLEEVAIYLTDYGELPGNYLTKQEAQRLGWSAKQGNLWQVAYGCSIGGDRFGNYEGLLPEAKGRKWTECDIDFDGGYRGAKRIIFSNDGLLYYTEDHYESFDELEVIRTSEESGATDPDTDWDSLLNWLFGG